jgi:hypothetical protein
MKLGYKDKLTPAQSGLGLLVCRLAEILLEDPDAELPPALYAMADHYEASLKGEAHELSDAVSLLYSMMLAAVTHFRGLEVDDFPKAMCAIADNILEYQRDIGYHA